MAYDEALAARIRTALRSEPGVMEKKMFGGIAFMVRGNMACGVAGDEIMVRVGPDNYEDALSRPHARPMDFTGRPMRGWLFVGPVADLDDDAFEGWVRRSLEHCLTLKPK
jgi:TfoX/Sxy family transcriptional regulator of competence genes